MANSVKNKTKTKKMLEKKILAKVAFVERRMNLEFVVSMSKRSVYDGFRIGFGWIICDSL